MDLILKSNLLKHCKDILAMRKNSILQAMGITREGLLQETKSSMGDKFETTRAQLQREEGKLNKQLLEVNMLEQRIELVERATNSNKIELGSLVLTTHFNYYLSIPIGKITIENNTYYAISPSSPIGQKLINQQIGSEFVFNGKSIKITNVI